MSGFWSGRGYGPTSSSTTVTLERFLVAVIIAGLVLLLVLQ